MQALVNDGYYASVYKIPLKAGNYLTADGNIDSLKVVLNEKAVKALGWNDPNDAVGRQLRVPNDPRTYTVQGVIQDFHFNSMQTKIEPFIIFNIRVANAYRYLSFKLKPGNIGNSIAAIQKKWATLLPGSSFEYKFMDETLEKVYASEIQMKKAAYTATFLSLIIVLLGVLGLISLSVQKRTKEIGIRKVLGSSVHAIIALFMKEFVVVVGIASLIACPLAYLIAKMWLNGYAYRIEVTAIPFIISMGLLAVLTCILIALQTLKAGVANPVKSLRTE
jgi:ABC-type antimicrobial peptide transport system permease subunit